MIAICLHRTGGKGIDKGRRCLDHRSDYRKSRTVGTALGELNSTSSPLHRLPRMIGAGVANGTAWARTARHTHTRGIKMRLAYGTTVPASGAHLDLTGIYSMMTLPPPHFDVGFLSTDRTRYRWQQRTNGGGCGGGGPFECGKTFWALGSFPRLSQRKNDESHRYLGAMFSASHAHTHTYTNDTQESKRRPRKVRWVWARARPSSTNGTKTLPRPSYVSFRLRIAGKALASEGLRREKERGRIKHRFTHSDSG